MDVSWGGRKSDVTKAPGCQISSSGSRCSRVCPNSTNHYINKEKDNTVGLSIMSGLTSSELSDEALRSHWHSILS